MRFTLTTRIALITLTLAAGLVDAAPATQPTKPYPFSTCVVSGESLGGDMGEPVKYEYQGQEIKFCCSSCLAKFKKNPDKYMKAIADAAAKQPTTKPAA